MKYTSAPTGGYLSPEPGHDDVLRRSRCKRRAGCGADNDISVMFYNRINIITVYVLYIGREENYFEIIMIMIRQMIII